MNSENHIIMPRARTSSSFRNHVLASLQSEHVIFKMQDAPKVK